MADVLGDNERRKMFDGTAGKKVTAEQTKSAKEFFLEKDLK